MMRALLISAALFLATGAVQAGESRADGGDMPPPPAFAPWRGIWQCGDIVITISSHGPSEINIVGTMWFGGRIVLVRDGIVLNDRPCVPLSLQPLQRGYR
jgi:hypothetical protein